MSHGAQVAFECPRCGYAMDAASAVRDGEHVQPAPGDISICLKCAAPLELAADISARWLTYEEVAALPKEQRGKLVQAIIAVVTMRPSAVYAGEWKR